MIVFDLDMTPIYKMEYDMQIIGIDDLRSYVQNGSLTKAGYKQIVGEDYDTQAQQTQPV